MLVGISRFNFNVIYWLVSAFALASCTSIESRLSLAKQLASDGNLQSAVINSKPFQLQAWHRGLTDNTQATQHNPLTVYIEGDGFAFKRRHQISDNPTPNNPVALRLATKDPSRPLIYIARPCQYIKIADCDSQLWTTHRYSEAVVQSVNQAISWGRAQSGSKSVLLIGFSGGGSIAALIAARRTDVEGLITVAGNLDHARWTSHHRVSPLSGSLNAIDIAEKIQHISQLHLVGAKDSIITDKLALAFKQRAGHSPNMNISVLPEFDHHCCWQENWPQLLCAQSFQQHPSCQTQKY